MLQLPAFTPFQKASLLPCFPHIKSNVFWLLVNAFTNLPHTTVQLHFLFSLAYSFCSLKSVCLSNIPYSFKSALLILLFTSFRKPSSLLCLLRYYLVFKTLCKIYFLSTAFPDDFSSWCFVQTPRWLLN